MALLEFTNKGICCNQARVYIDPWKPVEKAIVTHGHSDHARWGNKHYLAHRLTEPILKTRLGMEISVESLEYGQEIFINGVKFSLHPAGHIIGSAQVRVEYQGEVWVVSGDYKLEKDQVSEPFELVPCHTFITESTFGLPVYKWSDPSEIHRDINEWWRNNQEEGIATVLTGYSLGKAQRLLKNLDRSIGPVFEHGAIYNLHQVLREAGIDLQPGQRITAESDKQEFRRALILAPPSATGSTWLRRFYPYSIGNASGWMSLRGTRRRRSVDRGFALSDHADWDGLNQAIEATGAEKIIITHGYRNTFAKWLQSKGLDACVEETLYEGELGEIGESALIENEKE